MRSASKIGGSTACGCGLGLTSATSDLGLTALEVALVDTLVDKRDL